MSVIEVIKKRRSIRNFSEKDIPDDMIKVLIEALIWAPSAGNLQARKFYFVKNKKIKSDLAKAAFGQNFVAKAPIVVVGCTDARIKNVYGERGENLYSIQDVACSIMNFMLVAHEMGLGTVWVGAFDEKKVAHILTLAESIRPVALVPVGWPKEIPSAPKRVSVENTIIWVS